MGINTAILSRTGGNNGIGFAVPIDLARSVMERLVQYGKVIRGYLGVMIQPVTPELAKRFGLDSTQGALVGEVTRDSGAAEAGIRSGDVIVEFNGTKVDDVRHLRLMVARIAPGTEVGVKIVRDGKPEELKVTLKELPGEEQLASAGIPDNAPVSKFARGIELQDLNDDIRRAINAPADLEGALVAGVEPGSPADEAGLRRGDVILEIEHKDVGSASDAYQRLSDVKGDIVLLHVWTQGHKRYVAVNLGD